MAIDPIVNGSFDGTQDGWTFEGPSEMSVTADGAHEGLYCAQIIYNGECEIQRGTRINQTITIPNVEGGIFLEFWERTQMSAYSPPNGIQFNEEWVWRVGIGTPNRQDKLTNWARHRVNINNYKGQTVQLAITYYNSDAYFCFLGSNYGWIRVDNIKIVLPDEILYEIDILSNPAFATLKVDGQNI